MIKKGRIIVIGGEYLKVSEPPTTQEDPQLGLLYVFKCVRSDDTEVTVRRSPNARIEVAR